MRYNSVQMEGYHTFLSLFMGIGIGLLHSRWLELEQIYDGLRKVIFMEIMFGVSTSSVLIAYIPLLVSLWLIWWLRWRVNASQVSRVNGVQIPCNSH